MRSTRFLFAGIFATFAFAWFGLAMVPQFQIGNLQPQIDEEAGDIYPIDVSGLAGQGSKVYAANGCIYCHSQQIRDKHMGSDIDRGWGTRRTVARDYIYDQPAFLGSMRMGPDLTNIGARQSNAKWHYNHLYNPRSVTPGSIMPPFRFLFENRKIIGERSLDALDLVAADAPKDGYEIVPTNEAKALVGYLMSLNKTHPIKEVKEGGEGAASSPPTQTPTAPNTPVGNKQ